MHRALVLVASFCSALAAQAAIRPYGLECEALRDPVGIDVARPRLGWKLESAENSQRQTAYQIQVASSLDLLSAGKADVWDSRRVASERTYWIDYGGLPLGSFRGYWWRLRVWDAAGEPSGWSEAARWTTALLDAAGRQGSWIAHPDTTLRSGPVPAFRKEFTIKRPVRQALVMLSGAGFHELHVNGTKVGDRVLAPAWTNFRATMLYETFDITSALKEGANALGVLVGNGFYNVAGGRYAKYTGSFGHPRLWLQLHLDYAGGSSEDISTDDSWRVADSAITFSSIYGGEDYDARREVAGWDRAGFDDSNWLRPISVEAPGGALKAQASPPIKVQQTFKADKFTEPKPGVYVYDLGQNFSGWPRIAVTGPAGARVRMIPGELLDSNGLVTQRSSGGPVYFEYTLKGTGLETWAPRFTYYGFRYVQVEGAGPAISSSSGKAAIQSMEGEFVHLDAARIGRFECSNPLLNRIHSLIDAAVRSNLQHVLTDCPHREKLGWLEETYLMGPSLLYNWDLRAVLPKMIRDMAEAQLVSGLVPDIAPEYVAFGGGFRDSPEWGSASVLVPWQAWEWYGDRRALQQAYPMIRRYVDYLDSQLKDGLLTFGLGDWYDIGPKPPGYSQLTPQGVTGTLTFLRVLRAAGQIARVLGRQDDSAGFEAKAGRVQADFQRAFYRPGGYATGSQTSLAMPLALGIAPKDDKMALTDKLVTDIRSRGNHTSAGDIGYTYVISALLQAGRSDVIFDMATQPDPPSYAAQLAAGATTLTEAWDANPNSSQNHFMLGHIEQWFYAGLAGIRIAPGTSALSQLIIQPEPAGDVKWVKAEWNTFRGAVKVEWNLDGRDFKMRVQLPPGVTAEVRAPKGRPVQIGSGEHTMEARI